MKRTYPRKYDSGKDTFCIDTKHYKYNSAKSRATRIRWSGHKARIKSTKSGFLVYKGNKRIRRKK